MKKVIEFPNQERIQREAADWVVKLDGNPLPEAEQKDLRRWLESDPRHLQALKKMAQVWGELDCLAVLSRLFPELEKDDGPSLRSWSLPAWLGAAAAVVLSMGFLLKGMFDHSFFSPNTTLSGKDPVELIYQTKIGEQSEILLKDGSVLMLNTASYARVRMDGAERSVFLIQGEAHFEVAKNPDIPFVVYAGTGQVRALGTAFNVRIEESRVEVLVSEGVVRVEMDNLQRNVSPKEAVNTAVHNSTSVTLKQGGKVSYMLDIEAADYVSDEDIENNLAWRRGKWVFKGETLVEVIHEVARYTNKHIEIIDPRLADIRIGGYFDIGEIDAFLAALESGFGISVNRVADDSIELSVSVSH